MHKYSVNILYAQQPFTAVYKPGISLKQDMCKHNISIYRIHI